MTPEEIRKNIEFILEGQASFDEQLKRLRGESSDQKENIAGLMRLTDKLLELARLELETRKAEIKAEREARNDQIEAERKAREAQIEAEREARKAQMEADRKAFEADRAEIEQLKEMTKLLRELWEANLRRPEEPPPPSP